MFAATLMIISAVVGAGFATGAELLAFFGTSTLPPIWIAILVGIFLFCLMSALLYLPVRFSKKIFAPIFFIFFVAMTAGITELAGPVTAAIAVITSVLIVWIGFEKMLTANKLLMGFALVVLLVIVVTNLGETLPRSNLAPDILKTAGSALLYAGMNCCLLPGIFAQTKTTLSRKDLFVCVIVSVITISFFVLLLLTVIRGQNATSAPMPILAIADNIIVRFAVLVCILTSMFAALFNLRSETKKSAVTLSVIGALGYFLSFLGFTKVIGIFYPIVGIMMIGFVIFSFCLWLRGRFVCRHTREH